MYITCVRENISKFYKYRQNFETNLKKSYTIIIYYRNIVTFIYCKHVFDKTLIYDEIIILVIFNV